MEKQQYKTVFSSRIARELLRQGYTIHDIKPNKDNAERTVFIFKVEDGFFNILDSYEK